MPLLAASGPSSVRQTEDWYKLLGDQAHINAEGFPMNAAHLKIVKRSDMRPVAGRKANKAYRTREHLTEAEMTKLLAALKANRHGHRDWLIGLIIYRHGLR